MADVHDDKTRSFNMSQIKGKDSKPEMIIRRHLHANGFRYRLHVMDLPGKPDIVLPKLKTVIFVHGCFWHGHELCKKSKLPETRFEWWKRKIDKNIDNDIKNISSLESLGWRVIIVWECDLHKSQLSKTLKYVIKLLKQRC